MKRYKTIYSGAATLGYLRSYDDTLILDNQAVASYARLTSILSSVYWKAGWGYQQKIRDRAFAIKLLIPDVQKEGFWLDSLRSIEWFINNMVSPPGGIVFDIYFFKNLYPGITDPQTQHTIWPLKKRWLGDGDYITLQKISKRSSERKHRVAREIGHWNLIENIEKYSPYPVKEISYNNTEDEVAELLVHSKRHFVYDGGAYTIAGMIDVPTVCYGDPIMPNVAESAIYDIKEERLSPKSGRKRIKFEKSLYQATALGPGPRVLHFDIESNMCIHKPQTYVRHAWDKEELLGYITFSKDLEIANRDRKDWLDLTDLPDWPEPT